MNTKNGRTTGGSYFFAGFFLSSVFLLCGVYVEGGSWRETRGLEMLFVVHFTMAAGVNIQRVGDGSLPSIEGSVYRHKIIFFNNIFMYFAIATFPFFLNAQTTVL